MADTTTTTVPDKPECADGETLVVLRERPPSYQCVETPPAPPERGPQSTIPDPSYGVCYVYSGDPLPWGQYSLGPLERPHDGTTEIGALKCWAPVEVQAPQPEPGCIIDGVNHPLYVIDPDGPGLTGVGNIRCDVPPPFVEVITPTDAGTPVVPVPTAVNTGDALEPYMTPYESGGLLLASLAALLIGVRKIRNPGK